MSVPLRIAGLAGAILIVLAILYTTLRYRGKHGERYSLLNHFISELGEVGVSQAARVFNIGLVVGGLLLLPFVAGLGLALNSVLGWLGTLAGAAAGLGVAAVGIFPMNHLSPHVKAAMTYFRAGLVMVFFFGLAFLFQHSEQMVISPASNLFTLLAIVAYGSFLFLLRTPQTSTEGTQEVLNPEVFEKRPKFWLDAFLEWMVFFSTILWIIGVAAL